MRPTLYLAGPMSGIPELNFPAFRRAKEHLTQFGFGVISPLDLELNEQAEDKGGEDRHIYLREDFKFLCMADGIALLPGWEQSVGANAELAVARMLKMSIWEVHEDSSYFALFPANGVRPGLPKLFTAMGMLS